MNSQRYAPAGLLVEYKSHRVMIDGGVGAEPSAHFHCWLVTDEKGELIGEIRKLAIHIRDTICDTLTRPDGCFLRPDAVSIFCVQLARYLAQDLMIVSHSIAADPAPIERFGSNAGVRIVSLNLSIF